MSTQTQQKSSESTVSQIEVKSKVHLRLTPEDWEECSRKLDNAELKLFTWIRASDPFGDRNLKINCRAIGEKLGLHKSTISRALKSLEKKELISAEYESAVVSQRISNLRLTLLCKEENGSIQEKIEANETVAPTQHPLHPRNDCCTHATPVAPTQQVEAETVAGKAFQNPSYSYIPLKLLNTLSNIREREKNDFLGIKSNSLSLVCFNEIMKSISVVLADLQKDFSAAPAPPISRPNHRQWDAAEEDIAPIATNDRLRKLSLIIGSSIEALRTNKGLQKTLKEPVYAERFDDVLAYLEIESKSFKSPPGIGFVVASLKEGRKPSASSYNNEFEDFCKKLDERGLLGGYSYSSYNDIPAPYVVLEGSKIPLAWESIQAKGINWERLEELAAVKSLP